MILLVRSYPYHFVRTILSVPFCPIPFCPYTILSIPFCQYHFVRYHFVLGPTKLAAVAKFLYTPSRWGLALASDKEPLEKVIRRANRLGYLEESFPTVSKLAN